MSGRPTRATVEWWAGEVEAVAERIGPRFARREPRERAIGYLRGLLGDTERKNGWQLAEHLGEATPGGVQHLLARADGDADAVRGDRPRCREAGVPATVAFATKIALAKRMIERAVAAGVPAKRAAADAVSGSDYSFRIARESLGLSYAVGVRTDFAVWVGGRHVRVRDLLAAVATAQLRVGIEGAATVRLGDRAHQRSGAGAVRPPGVGAAERVRSVRGGVLRVRRPAGGDGDGGEFVSGAGKGGGRSRSVLNWRRAIAAWTSTRSGVGSGGTGT